LKLFIEAQGAVCVPSHQEKRFSDTSQRSFGCTISSANPKRLEGGAQPFTSTVGDPLGNADACQVTNPLI
jgi:hypothetical protein